MRKNNFDLLRLFFAFIVVFGHIIALTHVSEFQKFKYYFDTYLSVTAFFCISGFLIAKSYASTNSLKKYFVKRAARLLPAYITVIFVCAVCLGLISTYTLKEYYSHHQLYKYITSNLFFLNFLEPCLPGVFNSNPQDCAVNGALWTLKIEVSFYLLVPMLFYFLNKSKRTTLILLLIYVLSIIYRNILTGYSSDSNSYNILARQLPGFMSYFSCGIALYYHSEKFIKNKNWLFWVGIILFFIERKLNIEILTPLALSLMLFSIAFSFKFLNNILKFGDISYGIYIFHCPIIQTITFLGFFEKYNPHYVALITIMIVIFAGLLSWHFLEKKTLKAVRNGYSKTLKTILE